MTKTPVEKASSAAAELDADCEKAAALAVALHQSELEEREAAVAKSWEEGLLRRQGGVDTREPKESEARMRSGQAVFCSRPAPGVTTLRGVPTPTMASPEDAGTNDPPVEGASPPSADVPAGCQNDTELAAAFMQTEVEAQDANDFSALAEGGPPMCVNGCGRPAGEMRQTGRYKKWYKKCCMTCRRNSLAHGPTCRSPCRVCSGTKITGCLRRVRR